MTRRNLNPDDEFAALLRSVRRSSWRWECQGEYAVDRPEVERWLAGEPAIETDDDRAWLAHLARLRADGIPFQRVRVYPDPINDYLAWMRQAVGPNVAAGEDVRWLPEATAHEHGLPGYDFYLLDDERVAVLQFEDKELAGVVVDDDPAVLAEHRAWRDTAWPIATPHAEYVTMAR
ncbi:DUF6879 family protein [Amycolatopsis circi]|uniref:DUF6879 family protein n=1 Tax=Amycolatopsis circi TaxID=871959 RepID=UPI000E246537|nr:DUF6879 family protein [Amycolatopsis circi]